MKNKEHVLVVAAHPDDETLGAGGTLLKHKEAGDEISLLILANGEDSRNSGADSQKRWKQTKAVADALGAKLFTENLPDQQFDSVPLLSINKAIEKVVKEMKPTVVYTNHLGDLNLDHRIAAQATLTACRPQPGFSVKKILSFEVLSSTEWNAKRAEHAFLPTEYVDIADYLEEKKKILSLYKDELRPFPHPRSLEGVETLARFRGMEVGYEAAEAFEIIRLLR